MSKGQAQIPAAFGLPFIIKLRNYMERNAEYWIEKLKLIPHPEGGYFKETYRASEIINKEYLPERFPGNRNYKTSIYYLLKGNQTSKLHRIKSDELWHFYDGSGVTIYVIDEKGMLTINKLGLNFDEGELPQIAVKAGNWFGAEVSKPGSYCLAGCTVSPGFDFEDFEMGDRKYLLENFPEFEKIIQRLT